MACVKGRTDDKLWERSKAQAKREACKTGQRRCGAWDARIAQRAGKIYRDAGGGYCGTKTSAQRGLTKWTKEDWRTESGKKACRKTPEGVRCDRYLPAAAWKKLTKAEKSATQRVKRAAKTQFVANAPAAKRAGQKARRGR